MFSNFTRLWPLQTSYASAGTRQTRGRPHERYSDEHVLHPATYGVGHGATWPEMVFTRVVDGRATESWEITDTGTSWDSTPW